MDKYVIKTKSSETPGPDSDKTTKKAKVTSSTVSAKRKYNDEYIEFAFIPSKEDNSLPVCMLCSTTLSNEAMVPSKLRRHFEKKHPLYINKEKSYFENLRSQFYNQAKRFKNLCTVPEKAQIASYKIAQLLAKKKKPHADAENIILPSLEIAVEAMIGTQAVERVKVIPLSGDTIARRIQSMSDDIDLQLKEHFANNQDKMSNLWALQVDESTDISNKA